MEQTQQNRSHRKYTRNRWLTVPRLGGILGVLMLVTLIGGSFAQHGAFDLGQFFVDLWSNLGTELISIIITVYIIDDLNQQRAIEQQKEDLILQMGSPNNAFAVEAVRILRQKGWLEDGALAGASLERAALSRASLDIADLSGAFLMDANLSRADLVSVDLSMAILMDVDFTGADLNGANLRGADLTRTNLKGARYVTIDQLKQAETLEGVILPDGTQLPGRKQPYWEEPDWGLPFKKWCETVEVCEEGYKEYIIPAELDDEDDKD